MPRPRSLLIAVCASMLHVVASTGCSTPARRGYVVVERPGGHLEKVPVSLSAVRIPFDGLGEYPVARFAPSESRVPFGGGYAGLSGAPVYTGEDELVGGSYSNVLPGARGAPLALQPAEQVRLGFELGAARGTALGNAPPIDVGGLELLPGHSVGVFWLWGDLKRGTTGAVTYREGDALLMLSHSATRRRTGPVLGALVRTPVLAYVSRASSDRALCGWAGVVGAATYDGVRGMYARVGVVPPHVALSVVVRRDGEELLRRRYFAAKDDAVCSESLREAMAHAVDEVRGLARDTTASARVEVDGARVEELEADSTNVVVSELQRRSEAWFGARATALATVDVDIELEEGG